MREAPRKRVNPPYTKELGEEICQRIANGASGVQVCRDLEMPDWPTIARWRRTKQDFSKSYDDACKLRAEYWGDEIIDIADDATNDFMDAQRGKQLYRAFDREHFERSRLRMQGRQWVVARLLRDLYGDTKTVELSTPKGPLGIKAETRVELIDSILQLIPSKPDGKTKPHRPKDERE